MAFTPGLDVSHHQGVIDWTLVANAGNRFALMKATEGTDYSDPMFAQNWAAAKSAGLLASAYHFFIPSDSTEQIDYFFQVFGNRQADFALILDVEVTDNLTPSVLEQSIRSCVERMWQLGGEKLYPIIYTNAWFWNANLATPGDPYWSNCGLWVADWENSTPSLPKAWNEWKFWQYSDQGHVPGITGEALVDRFNGSFDELLQYGRMGLRRL